MVPNGWESGRVQDVISGLESGVSVNAEDRLKTQDEKAVLKISSVSYGIFNDKAHKTITDDYELSRARTSPKMGQIIISRANTYELVGASAYIEQDYNDLFVPDKLWQTISKPNIDMKWLSYILALDSSRYILSRLSTGTSYSMRNITKGELLTLKILIPPLPEQQKIAKILSTWDKAITTTEKLIATSKQQKKALMQQLLTGKKRLLNPETGLLFQGIWEEVKINKLLTESRITCADNNPNNRLTVRLKLKGVGKRVVRGTESIDSTAYFTRLSGQFIYGKQNIHKGAFGLVCNDLDGFQSSQDLPAFDFSSRCNSTWFFHFMSQENFYSSLESKMTGTGSKRLNPKAFLLTKISLPVKLEQQKIASVLTAADKEIKLLESKLAHLKQEKKALMQQLLTGKRRVKIDDVEVA